ncbi:RluA family pseudouridine synthase [Deinococcus marmoris]|uniref:Pseudouridine synthase n=1 Tax=Deinococcus marmoris TaxID=249408 RepID=A0A1U7P266_9DEIO|nr:RluA family pseudouridine synthase [Deinococcus marmoris]OLV19275.1 Ribosomal large subunit pseudouridine synthase D [Deinococcus marmoris]
MSPPSSTLNDGYAYAERIGPRGAGLSVLAYLAGRYEHSTPQEWQGRLERGEVVLDGVTAQGSEILRTGQSLIWHRPPWPEDAVPLHFDVLYEDTELLAVCKPSGLPTVPAGGFLNHTLFTLVRERWPEASPLHRLGRATSGLVLFSRTAQAGAALSRDWREGRVQKIYRALAQGLAGRDEYEITTPIGPVPHPRLGDVYAASAGGKPSHSTARVLERRSACTLFEVDIHTGRPHQIRIHLASIGHPLVGDPLYGAGGLPLADLPGLPGDGGYLLHAHRLGLVHPVTGQEMVLTAPPPASLNVIQGVLDTSPPRSNFF